MKFKINRDHFVAGLQKVQNVVGTRATMPILSNVLIEAEKDHISLTTNNLDLGICCRVKAEVAEEGSITLPVRRLYTIVKSLPNLEVEIDVPSKNQAKITSGGSLFRIMGIGKEEFQPLPTISESSQFVIPQDRFLNMLKSVSYAQSTDENRYILNGVYLRFKDNKLTMVATDGRRLSLINQDMEIDKQAEGSLVLPAKTTAELERLLGQGEETKIILGKRQVAFEISAGKEAQSVGLVNNVYLVSKIVEGTFPDYNQVIPSETAYRIQIDRELLLESLSRAALVNSDKGSSIKIKINKNRLDIFSSSSEFGEAHESVAINHSGPDVELSFNPHFLMDPLRALPKDEVYFEFKDELSPGLFKTHDSFVSVIMPLRLN